jgi:hypothetical protein
MGLGVEQPGGRMILLHGFLSVGAFRRAGYFRCSGDE